MECAVCYGEQGPFQKLCCGHTFCTGCIKQWYLKGVSSSGANSSCPMCRKPIYFKGFHKVREQWNEDAWENRCAEVFSEALDEAFSDAQDMAESFPERFRPDIMEDAILDMIELEKTYRFLKAENIDADDIAYVLMETMDYYSDRHLDRVRWLDEPPRDWVSRYTRPSGSARSAKRARQPMDEWVTLSFYVEL